MRSRELGEESAPPLVGSLNDKNSLTIGWSGTSGPIRFWTTGHLNAMLQEVLLPIGKARMLGICIPPGIPHDMQYQFLPSLLLSLVVAETYPADLRAGTDPEVDSGSSQPSQVL